MTDEFDSIIKNSIPPEEIEKLSVNWDYDSSNKPKKTLNNVVNYFLTDPRLKKLFKYNIFSHGIEYTRTPEWNNKIMPGRAPDDNDIIQLKYYLSSAHKFDIETAKVLEAVIKVSLDNQYHPIKEYLENLNWDHTKRLDTWLIDYAGVEDNEYTRAVSRKIIVAAITRIYFPGYKFDYMPILEGQQGIGKSRMIAALGGKWYSDVNIFINRDHDTIDAMRGKWIIEVAELAFFRRVEIEGAKAFLSRQTDRVRLVYERLTRDFPRQCVFLGTINPDDEGYLRDGTGNRRFWPVLCTKADVDGLARVRDQLFAEALEAFGCGGFKELYLDDKINLIAKAHQLERETKEIWADVIQKWLDNPETLLQENYTFLDILTNAIKMDPARITAQDRRRVGVAMRELGFNIEVRKVNKKPVKVFYKNIEFTD